MQVEHLNCDSSQPCPGYTLGGHGRFKPGLTILCSKARAKFAPAIPVKGLEMGLGKIL